MKRKEYCKKYENCILTFIIMLLNVILMGVCFDFYYDLNDDMLMKDIMSGVYTGTPDGHNMQTLYVLGAIIGLCYRLCGRIPWYGLFLCLCQFGCIYLLGVRLTGLIDHRYQTVPAGKRAGKDLTGKVAVLLILLLFQWGICLPHMVNIQYTITCAIMSATAIFLFVTTPETESTKQFVIKNIPSMLLVIIAYQLRTEMLLLTLPFVALAGMFRWAEEEKIFTKENWKKYGTVVGVMLAGMLVSRCIDFAAYGSEEWKDFLEFFNARTTVYDFYPEVVTQDEFAADLEQLGVTPVQQLLLRNYNFGLDDSIDTQMLQKIADYAAGTVGGSRNWGAVIRETCRLYAYRLFHTEDAPYNVIVLWAYAAVTAAGISAGLRKERRNRTVLRQYSFVWQIALVAAVRTAVWMFILVRGRYPQRITHSLYLVEFFLLTAMLIRSVHVCGIKLAGSVQTAAESSAADRTVVCRRNKNFLPYLLRGMAAVLLIIFAVNSVTGIHAVRYGQQQREAVNRNWQDIDVYCRAYDDNFYFEDVYSWAAFSQRMFANVNNTLSNYDILGGWNCKSPSWKEKLEQYGIDSAADALLYQDNVYLIMSDKEAAEQGFDWIIDYYAQRGVAVSVRQSDTINEYYAVYEIVQ